MSKKDKILYGILLFLIILFFLIIIYVFNNRIIKYDDYKINEVSNYLKVNSLFYDGIQENLKKLENNFKIDRIDDIELNKQVASYVITNIVPNIDYGYEECNSCFKYFSKDDNIRFYNVQDVDYVYNQLFDGEIKKITQEDLIDFNILYYNEDINKYYVNVAFNSYRPSVILEFKDYNYEDDMLYMDYYYARVMYNQDYEELNDTDERIYLYSMNNMMVKELMYNDIYSEDNVIININNYVEYFDIIRYMFKYDKDIDQFKLYRIKILDN